MGKFERIRYPDGQIGAKWVAGKYDGNPLARRDNDTLVKERINSYEDLMYVRAIAEVLQSQNLSWRCFIPCLFGQRSDRRFESGQSFDLKIITDVINSCDFESVEIFDPHSDVSLALINRSTKRSPLEYVEKAFQDILSERQLMGDGYMTDILLVSPDAGAYKKVYEFGEKLNCPVMGAMKHRDKDGTIAISFTHDVEGKDCLIVDDLCDGGATFISLARILRLHKARKVYLYVSHGLFSKGFDALQNVIDHIYCTNSYRDIPNYAIETSSREDTKEYVKQVQDFITQYKVI